MARARGAGAGPGGWLGQPGHRVWSAVVSPSPVIQISPRMDLTPKLDGEVEAGG